MMTKCISIIAALFTLFSAASAAPDVQAEEQFIAGNYQVAIDQALEAGGAENLALAARALNAQAYLSDDDKIAKRAAKRAAKLADEAVDLDPLLVEGYLQGAIAMAQRGARISAVKAFFLGLGGGSRNRLDTALELEPENPWALSTSAGWHLGIAALVGDGRFGCDVETGYRQFQAARLSQPENVSVAYEAALRVLALKEKDRKEGWREFALQALADAQTAPPQTAFEAALQERARAFSLAIETGPEAEAAYIKAQG